MSIRFWRRLAGCIATSLALTAAAPEYRAGAAGGDHVRAVAIEDRRGHRAVFAEADFPVTRALSDFVAVQLLKTHDLDRAAIVISGKGDAPSSPIVTVVEHALADLHPAALSGALSIRSAEGACIATLYPIRLGDCRDGAAIRGPIRAAVQMVDLPHPLQTRAGAAQAYPVQAIAIGKLTILALGGEVPAGRFPGMVVSHANDTGPLPADASVAAAIANVLKRIH